ncbi:hypothetical protein SVAN01_10943 [Stagonosporopsis vannaccii]|nr:hypothetical protein SVAN01_10943 [Stagonosporopsis vannaccii]
MSSEVFFISDLPSENDIYTHPEHKSKAWVIFSSPVAPRELEGRRLFEKERKHYVSLSSRAENSFVLAPGAGKAERYTDFVADAEKEKEKRTSTLLITGLTSEMLRKKHGDQFSPPGLEHNTAYCERDQTGHVKVQFFDKKDAETTWEEIKDNGMHRVYHVTARFVDNMYR